MRDGHEGGDQGTQGLKIEFCNNPVKLLKAIKKHALNYQESRYKMLVISDGFTTSFGTRQKDKEILQDCTRIFKTSYKVLQLHIEGPIQL